MVGTPRSRPGSAPAHLPEREEEGERGKRGEREPEKPELEVTTFLLPRAAEPREEDFVRNKAAPVFTAATTFWFPVSSATQARVCPKQNCWSAFTGRGTTSTRAKVALGWRGASWAKLSLPSATTSCFDPKEGQTCGSSSTSPS